MRPLSRRLLSTGFVVAASLRTAGLRPAPSNAKTIEPQKIRSL